jgi:hypothetical protein
MPLTAPACPQEKLRLDADDEQAVEWLQQLINESATALMPQFIETTHRWARAHPGMLRYRWNVG